MITIFNYSNPATPHITKARMKSVIFETGASTPNADINFDEGYLNGEGEFVSCGVNHLHIEDSEAVIDPETQEVTTPAGTDFTDFMAALNAANDTEATADQFLISKVGA